MKFYIAFDFSINKPAMAFLPEGESVPEFYIWPLSMSDKLAGMYASSRVHVSTRGLESVKKDQMDESELTMEHTIRSIRLATAIVDTISSAVSARAGDEPAELFICSEGLSFASVGDATLNLATYKGVLLSKLVETYGGRISKLYTFAPITIKKTAGCSSSEFRGDKTAMIRMFAQDCPAQLAKDVLAGKFDAGKGYKECMDDIADSYWAMRTMFKALDGDLDRSRKKPAKKKKNI